jgi:hypothetical protein
MLLWRRLAVLCGALAGMILGLQQAYACACCTNTGQRHEAVEALHSGTRDELDRLRFAPEAQLFTREADPDMIKGVAARWAQFDLGVKRERDRWIFTFSDKDGRSGTLTLAMPKSIAVFAVDPRRGEREGGTVPTLYREWKLSAPAAGTGMFAAGTGKRQRITLILQGHGNSCASAVDFSHWTLAISGPVARYHLFGALLPP